MIEPATMTAVGVGVWGGKDLIVKFFGPTADHYGGKLKEYLATNSGENIQNILSKAAKKLGDKINQSGHIGPRLLKDLMFEGAFCENDVEAEYRAGILASSKLSPEDKDLGIPFVALINRLSPLHLLAHYILYSCVKTVLNNSNIKAASGTTLHRVHIGLELSEFIKYINQIMPNADFGILSYLLHLLDKEKLINSEWAIENEEFKSFPKYKGKIPTPAFIFSPSPYGCEFFLWANGVDKKLHEFFKLSWEIKPIDNINIDYSKVVILSKPAD
jgi:hypothetical protein